MQHKEPLPFLLASFLYIRLIPEEQEGELFEVLEALIDKSLLRREEGTGGEARFSMLETIREYAAERLAASHEEVQVRARHASFFAALGEQAEVGFHGPEEVTWRRRLETEHGNLRAAWRTLRPR